uniref:Putative secreted peptide n=1 Tax=Anopheles braziliensis TaxID=58242 RepID=A0A2M3ZTM7_9DIPT
MLASCFVPSQGFAFFCSFVCLLFFSQSLASSFDPLRMPCSRCFFAMFLITSLLRRSNVAGLLTFALPVYVAFPLCLSLSLSFRPCDSLSLATRTSTVAMAHDRSRKG